jgi:hypothetical protein
MKPAEIQWRLLRAERRALDGPEFQSPAVSLARAIDRMRKLLVDLSQKPKPDAPLRIYDAAVEYYGKQIESLLPLVSVGDLSKALSDLANTKFTNPQQQVLDACWRIFERTRSEPDSILAIREEILTGTKNLGDVPSFSTVHDVLNRLEIPTKPGKRGPKRGSRHKKTSRKRV